MSSSSGSDPFSSALSGLGGAATDPAANDPNFKMKHSSVRKLGDNVAGHGQDFTAMSAKTRAIDMDALTFGVIGGGLNVAHRSVRDSAADALQQGKEVLDSWKAALRDAADNTEMAEEASKAKDKAGGLPQVKDPGGLGGLGSGGLGGLGKTPGPGDLGGVGPGDLGGIDKPPAGGIDTPKIPDDLDKPDLDQPDLDQPELDTPDPGDLDKPGAGDIEQPDLSGIDKPTVPGLEQPDLKNPDLSGLNQPNGTDLAGVNPNLPNTSTPQIRTPDLSGLDPRTTMPRTGMPEGVTVGPSVGAGSGPGAGGAGSGLGGQGSIARALNSGMPIYPPPMGGGGGPGSEDKDRERGPHLSEEEGVWGADDEYAPAVLGREE
ncbi:hypothetical protein [Nonomuraea sp. NPDC050643]|uniref:hypothetical protein n=1 Tax=Nonomuraea sp. NPDC050643 TaxID=3155660 RepID=UPI0033F3600D